MRAVSKTLILNYMHCAEVPANFKEKEAKGKQLRRRGGSRDSILF